MQRDKYSVILKQITLMNRPFSESKMHCYSVILRETDKWLFKVYGKTRKVWFKNKWLVWCGSF